MKILGGGEPWELSPFLPLANGNLFNLPSLPLETLWAPGEGDLGNPHSPPVPIPLLPSGIVI